MRSVQCRGPVESADIVKGYDVDKDVYVTLEEGERDALKLESKRTLDLTSMKLDKEMVALARALIAKKAAPFEPGQARR